MPPTNIVMPALELAQETGKVLRWLKSPGDRVQKGEPLVEIETDKITTELEAPAEGVLADVTAGAGDVVKVGITIARIVDAAEARSAGPGVTSGPASAATAAPAGSGGTAAAVTFAGAARSGSTATGVPSAALTPSASSSPASPIKASPLARRIAEEHGIDLAHVKTSSGKIEKADVLAYIESRKASGAAASTAASPAAPTAASPADGAAARLTAASPKARRLAAERGLDLATLRGSGPAGAILVDDVVAVSASPAPSAPRLEVPVVAPAEAQPVGTVWRVMAERMTASWTTAPHFYLVREVNVSRLVVWRGRANHQSGGRITYSDLLVKLVAAAIARHPNVNASWRDGAIVRNADINIGLAVATDAGLIVPIIHRADTLSLAEIAARREDIVSRAQVGKLRPADIQGGGFTISNLGMYGVDAFSAILNPPQAAILAVGRIADRVVAVNGQPLVQPTMVLTLSGDHRAVDGARGAQFLGELAELIEEPLALLL